MPGTFRPLLAAIAILAAFTAALEPLAATENDSITTPRWVKEKDAEGIWKAVTPPGNMKGEFESHDPIGLASGTLIKADCSINWVSPDTGKLYCFASGTSLVYFLNWPKKNTKRASNGWETLSSPTN
ncbi:MAG: hypothetical protein RIC14_07955 [Filomicrobium sp.]